MLHLQLGPNHVLIYSLNLVMDAKDFTLQFTSLDTCSLRELTLISYVGGRWWRRVFAGVMKYFKDILMAMKYF